MKINLINIEGPFGDNEDWNFYFTINDSNNNIIQSFENGISFFEIWKVLNENFQKEVILKLLIAAMNNGNI